MNIEKYFWICPKCNEKVDGLKQLVDSCFDEQGEAEFMVELWSMVSYDFLS